MHASKNATRFEAWEPLRQVVRGHFGGFLPLAFAGLRIRPDHGLQCTSDRFRKEPRFRGMEASPASVRQPEDNDFLERVFRTLKERLLCVLGSQNLEELQAVLRYFRNCYNRKWLIQRLRFQSPRQACQRSLRSSRLHDDAGLTVQEIARGKVPSEPVR